MGIEGIHLKPQNERIPDLLWMAFLSSINVCWPNDQLIGNKEV